jgi:hypothetical protein
MIAMLRDEPRHRVMLKTLPSGQVQFNEQARAVLLQEVTRTIKNISGRPLHITALIERIAAKFGASVDRESLVSALSKRVKRQDRFSRTDKNTLALLAPDSPRP